MAKKRLILPKEIQSLLEIGDIENLKKLFALCEPNALRSRSYQKSSNIFSLTPLPKEFAFFAKEQGADLNFIDGYGFTPIFSHASSCHGNVPLLIELVAEVNILMYDGTTPLHNAAVHGQIEAVNALLSAGANINAGLGLTWGTALESAIRQNQLPFAVLLEICAIFINHNAQVTDRAKASLLRIATKFQCTKKKIKDPEFLRQQTNALHQLYEILDVNPTTEIDLHKDLPLMTIKEIFQKDPYYPKQFQKLWDYLVPPRSHANTAQGEVIRIAGRIEHEMLDNGSINWDDDFRKMLHILPKYFRLGTPLPNGEIKNMEDIADKLNDGEVEDKLISWLPHYAVWWVRQNSQLIPPLPADYSR